MDQRTLDVRTMARMRGRLELFFGVPFGAPETSESERVLGLADIPQGYYCATRFAPMGAVSPAVVEACLFGFASRGVRDAVPLIWDRATPEQVLAAHLPAVDAALLRRLGGAAEGLEIAEAAALLHQAVAAADVAGRPLAAALRDLPWPDAPHLAIWHGMSFLRDHRGDGHIAALVSAGLDAARSHQLFAAAVLAGCACHPSLGGRPDLSETLRTSRRHSRAAWATATGELVEQGLLDAEGGITEAGAALHAALEDQTDRSAAGPFLALGADDLARLDEALRPSTRALASAG